ncbi:MAG TPA: hypothetical protein VE685_23765 [Thermoanaerobaculia bacterium]|nr:hypothetical protein [Thermoanaerobaculia bacterium]
MKRNVVLAALALSLAVFGAVPSLAEEAIHEKATSDPLAQLFNEGWVQVSSGVLTRDLGHGKVEVLGFGTEGLQYRLQEMRKHLRHLKATYDQYPTPELKDSLRAYRTEIRRIMERLETAKSVDELDVATQAAGIDCTINYGAHVNAFALGGSTQGVGANADAYFNSNCGQRGEVWSTAYGEARRADNSFWTATKTDPLSGVYSGTNVRAAGSVSVNGVKDCFSYAYANMTSYDIGVVYEQRVENRSCPAPVLNLTVSSNYGSSISVYGYNCVTVTWTANPTGGTSPYTYSWTANTSTTVVGTAQTYSRQFCGSNTTTTGSWKANATVTDSSSPTRLTKSASRTLTINYYYQSTSGCTAEASTVEGKATDAAIPPPCPY